MCPNSSNTVRIPGPDGQCGWTQQHVPVDPRRQVDPEEGQRGIGNGIDQPAHQRLPVSSKTQVTTAEWDDPRIRRGPSGDCEAIGPQASAEDRRPALERGPIDIDQTNRPASLEDARRLPSELQLAAGLLDV